MECACMRMPQSARVPCEDPDERDLLHFADSIAACDSGLDACEEAGRCHSLQVCFVQGSAQA